MFVKSRTAQLLSHRQALTTKLVGTILIITLTVLVYGTAAEPQSYTTPVVVKVNKCCEKFEVIKDGRCIDARDLNGTETFEPIFTAVDTGEPNVNIADYKFLIGYPDCKSMQMWPIYQYPSSTDKLVLLADGRLRHYIKDPNDDDEAFVINVRKPDKPLYFDYDQGRYCMDKALMNQQSPNGEADYALVCQPEKTTHWTDSDFLLRKIINPIFHGISMIILTGVAIVYFILPTLRDLVGNIVTTILMCLVISQAADLVRIFTEFSSHVSFLVADSILYVSWLAAFFWLNSMGFYIWKTFRSRNVFLRVTDGRKYCYYSIYVWSITGLFAALAIFAHFFLDTGVSKKQSIFEDQETIGWLGIAVFFSPIAFIIIINLFFYVTTLKTMNRISIYGRIHHKLRCSFILFTLIFVIMTIGWLFLILSWLEYDTLLYAHIFVNALIAPAIAYVAVIRQKHVTFLLRKTCCYNEPVATTDWGDELTYMKGGDY